MEQYAQLSSSDSVLPISAYTTRSANRKSLNVKTDLPSDQPTTDTSTPSTPSIDPSTDLQKSPASSQTSSNVIETSSTHISPSRTTVMPPKAKAAKGARARSSSIPDIAVQTTDSKPGRPGRARKPTQKAAELAANRSSKLFKSITERQASKDVDDEDREYISEEVDPLSIGETHGNGVKAPVAPQKTTPASVKQQVALKRGSPSPTTKPEGGTGIRKAANTPAPETTITASKKRKNAEGPNDLEEPPLKNTITASRQVTRSKSVTPAAEIASVALVATSTIKPTKSPRKRKQTEEPEDLEQAPTKKTKTSDTRLTRSKSKTPATETASVAPVAASTIKSIKPSRKRRSKINAATATEETIENEPSPTEPQNNHPQSTKPTKRRKHNVKTDTNTTVEEQTTETATFPKQPQTEPSPSPSKPTRLKFKPLSPTVASALEGVTGIPCGLSCLENDQLFYAWARIAVEDEELADEVCEWPRFEKDMSRKACLLRRRWNVALAGFCVCGRSEGVVTGAGGGG